MSKNSKIIKLLSTDEFDRVDIFLKKNIAELSRSRLNQLIRDNCVSINDKENIKPSTKVCAGDQIQVIIPPPEKSFIFPLAVPLINI